MMELDHIAVAGETLAEASEAVEAALGVPLQAGGEHDVFHTHNRLLGLADGLYLEAIAVNADAPRPNRPRWFDLDRFSGAPRLTNWICRTADMDGLLPRLPLGVGAPVALRRGELRWRMAVPADGVLPFDNRFPALIQWDCDTHPAARLADRGCALRRLVVMHAEAAALRVALSPYLDDARVVFEAGASALLAEIDTPHGLRQLS